MHKPMQWVLIALAASVAMTAAFATVMPGDEPCRHTRHTQHRRSGLSGMDPEMRIERLVDVLDLSPQHRRYAALAGMRVA